MKPHLLMTGAMMPMIISQLEAHFTVHKMWENGVKYNNNDIVAIATGGHKPVNAALQDILPNLKIVSNFGVGYDSVDAAHAGKKGIYVTHTPTVLNEEVADTCLALLLATVRQIPQQDRFVRSGAWVKGAYPLTRSLQERSIGILGLGRIGKAIAKRLEAFNCPISYHNRTKDESVNFPYYKTLVELAKAVDTLIIVVPGGASTKHIVNKEVLEALGSDGIVINIGRGTVVDEQALITALNNKTIASAGLDVFEFEPKVPQELLENDNIVMLPHIGSGTHYTRDKMGQLVVDNLIHWLEGKNPITPVPETPLR